MKFIFLLFVVFAAAQCASIADTNEEDKAWEAFKAQYHKKYDSVNEEKLRKTIFMENKHEIHTHNQEYEKGLVSYSQGINKFTDMLYSEFIATYTGFKFTSPDNFEGATFISTADSNPAYVNWTEKGAVTKVKDQKNCGSCWAFSSTGALEGQEYLVNGKLISLSEQFLVDCSKSNSGCYGGLMAAAYDDIKKIGGIDSEEKYPYEGVNGVCRHQESAATVSGYTFLNDTQKALTEATAKKGPIAVGIQVLESFQHYKSGVYYEPKCSDQRNDDNHAVLVAGYGTDKASGEDYYLVKNSWGTNWGEYGYIRMARNRDHDCGITTYALYPQV